MRILVTGSRFWTDYEKVARGITVAIDELTKKNPKDKEIVIVHGGATGADTHAHEFANKIKNSMRARGYTVKAERHKANWIRFGDAAGPIRNAEMIALGADICVAFIGKASKGTWDCINKADEAKIPVLKFYETS